MAKKDEAKAEGEAAAVETADSPLLDLTDAAVKRMLKVAKKRGWVTQDELERGSARPRRFPPTRSRT